MGLTKFLQEKVDSAKEKRKADNTQKKKIQSEAKQLSANAYWKSYERSAKEKAESKGYERGKREAYKKGGVLGTLTAIGSFGGDISAGMNRVEKSMGFSDFGGVNTNLFGLGPSPKRTRKTQTRKAKSGTTITVHVNGTGKKPRKKKASSSTSSGFL